MKTAAEFFEEKLAYESTPTGVRQIIDKKDKNYILVDVRDPDTYKKGHVPGAINIYSPDLERGLKKLPKNKTIIFYCYNITCFAAPKAALFAAKKGYTVMEMFGGFEEYKNRGHPVEKGGK